MARERYLVGVGEDTIHANEVVPVTAKQKRENWWFYYKTKLIVGVICVLIVGSFIYSMVTKVEPDYTIGVITSFAVPDSTLTQLENHLQEYADDRNGDGKRVVTIMSYPFSSMSTDPQEWEATFVRFSADVATGESMIFFHDEEGFSSLSLDSMGGVFAYNDGSPMPEGATDYENAMTDWMDIPVLAEFQAEALESDIISSDYVQELLEGLRISTRTDVDAGFSKDKKAQAYYEASMSFLERLKNGEKVAAN